MEKIKIGDACDILNGYAFKSDEYVNEGIRIIRIANVQKGYIEDDAPAFYPMNSIGLNKYMLKENDLLMSLTGNVGRVALLQKEMLPAALNQRVACLRLKTDKLIKRYLFHILNSDFFEQHCIQASKGVAQKNMSTEWLKDYEIPLYSIEEQLEIIEVLDKTRNVISLRKDELSALDDLIKARFVELTEEIETASTRMGDIATYLNGYAFKPTQWEETGLPIIRIQNLNDKNAPYNYFLGSLADRYFVQNGDVLVSWATHLEAYIWKGQDAWLNQHIFKVVFDKMEVDKIYFVYACEEALRQAFRNAHGFKPTMEHIKKADFDNAIVKLPKIEVQEQFADFVNQVDKSKVVVFNPIYYYNK